MAFVVSDSVIVVALSTLNLSGTVSVDGSPGIRQILIYKNGDEGNLYTSTWSNSGGAWSVSVVAGPNDRFRAIAVGIEGENDQVFGHLVAG